MQLLRDNSFIVRCVGGGGGVYIQLYPGRVGYFFGDVLGVKIKNPWVIYFNRYLVGSDVSHLFLLS